MLLLTKWNFLLFLQKKADNNREESNNDNSRQNSRESSVDTTSSSSYNGSNPDELRSRADDYEMNVEDHQANNHNLLQAIEVASKLERGGSLYQMKN